MLWQCGRCHFVVDQEGHPGRCPICRCPEFSMGKQIEPGTKARLFWRERGYDEQMTFEFEGKPKRERARATRSEGVRGGADVVCVKG